MVRVAHTTAPRLRSNDRIGNVRWLDPAKGQRSRRPLSTKKCQTMDSMGPLHVQSDD